MSIIAPACTALKTSSSSQVSLAREFIPARLLMRSQRTCGKSGLPAELLKPQSSADGVSTDIRLPQGPHGPLVGGAIVPTGN